MFLPSILNRGSYLPGPHELYCLLRRRRGGRQRDDRSDVQVAVRPIVETVTDSGRERVVDCRVAERTADTHTGERVARFTWPMTPSTAPSLSSATVVAGSFRLMSRP
jgi:hypothetical protein